MSLSHSRSQTLKKERFMRTSTTLFLALLVGAWGCSTEDFSLPTDSGAPPGILRPAGDIGAGLEAYWPLDGDFTDASGNGNDGTAHGGSFTADRNGSPSAAYRFVDGPGNGGDYIDTPFTPVYTPGESFSISLWLETTLTNQYMYLLGFEKRLAQQLTLAVRPGGGIGLAVRDDNWNHAQSGLITPTTVNDGAWHHVVAIRDVASDEIRVYIDGVLDLTVADDTQVALNATATRVVRIGGNNHSHAQPIHPDAFTGSLDEIRFYARALTDEEVRDLAELDPQTKEECKKGGWESFGFRNQGLCIQFVNTGKDSRE